MNHWDAYGGCHSGDNCSSVVSSHHATLTRKMLTDLVIFKGATRIKTSQNQRKTEKLKATQITPSLIKHQAGILPYKY